MEEAYARCFNECQFCQLHVSDYALLWEIVDASDLVSGPTAAFTRKCLREKLEPYAVDIVARHLATMGKGRRRRSAGG